MKHTWITKQLLAVVAAIGLVALMLFCTAGCSDDGKSSTSYQYQYEGDSFTDTYKLYDDDSYKRVYAGADYSSLTLESGTYAASESSVTFYVESISDSWPNAAYSYYWVLTNSYSGSLSDDYLRLSYGLTTRTYKKSGTVHSSK